MKMRRNLLLLLPAILAVAISAEIYLRVQVARERTRIRDSMNGRALCTEASPDERLLYTYTPGECGANSRGFCDVEHAVQKPKGTFRIALIGDSVAEGRGVDPDSAFGRVLERMLNARGGKMRYEVILLARTGYSTSQELVLLEDEAPRYDPDLILWSYCLDDPADPVFHNANDNLGRYYDRPTLQLEGLARALLFRAKQKLHGRGCPQEFHAFLHCAFHDDILRDLYRIATIAGRGGVPVAFVLHPVLENEPSFEDYSLAGVHADIDASALGAGFAVIDVLEAFRPCKPADLWVYDPASFEPGQMNPRGHQITAEFIGNRLIAEHLVP
jgi:hypothetical protein